MKKKLQSKINPTFDLQKPLLKVGNEAEIILKKVSLHRFLNKLLYEIQTPGWCSVNNRLRSFQIVKLEKYPKMPFLVIECMKIDFRCEYSAS